MASDATNPAARIAFLGAIDAALPSAPPAIDKEVVALFDELRGGLLRYVVSLGIGVHDSEDLIQEVFLQLFRHLRIGRSRANLRGWVFRVAHNLALKHRRRTQRQNARSVTSADTLDNHLDPAANPEQQFADGQQQRRLLLVVTALPEQDQRCLRLRAEGLRYREIASVLGMSLGAVSKSLSRSIDRLLRADGAP